MVTSPPTDKEKIQQALAMLYAAYPSMLNGTKEENQARSKVYAMTLEGLDVDLIQAAVLTWVSADHEYPPRAGQLRKLVEGMASKARGDGDFPDTLAAFDQAKRYAAEVMLRRGVSEWKQVSGGKLVDIPFPEFHPAVITAVKALGIERIFYANPEDSSEMGVLMAQWRDTFGVLRTRDEAAKQITHPAIKNLLEGVSARMRLEDPNARK